MDYHCHLATVEWYIRENSFYSAPKKKLIRKKKKDNKKKLIRKKKKCNVTKSKPDLIGFRTLKKWANKHQKEDIDVASSKRSNAFPFSQKQERVQSKPQL